MKFVQNKNNKMKVAVTLLILGLAACGQDKTDPATTSAKDAIKPADKQASEEERTIELNAPGGYVVAESFNVGDNIYVRSMVTDEVGQGLWVGTSIGVIEVDLKTHDMRKTYTRDDGLANEYVFGMMVDSENTKWFGTNGGGMTSLKDNTWKTYFPMHGLADYWVYSFAEQQDGTLWIGTWAGLSRFDKKTGKFTNYVKELVNEWVYGLVVDSKNQVWVGTEGGVNMYDGSTWHVWTHKDGLGADNLDNLPISDNTGLGTRSRHDLSVMQMGMQTYNPNYVFTLQVAKDDTIWAGTWGGGVSHFDGTKWTNYTSKDGLAGDIVYSVTEDNSGALWFGTNGGLSRYDGKEWVKLTKKNGLIDNNIYALAPTNNNDIWAGSKSGVMLLTKQ